MYHTYRKPGTEAHPEPIFFICRKSLVSTVMIHSQDSPVLAIICVYLVLKVTKKLILPFEEGERKIRIGHVPDYGLFIASGRFQDCNYR